MISPSQNSKITGMGQLTFAEKCHLFCCVLNPDIKSAYLSDKAAVRKIAMFRAMQKSLEVVMPKYPHLR